MQKRVSHLNYCTFYVIGTSIEAWGVVIHFRGSTRNVFQIVINMPHFYQKEREREVVPKSFYLGDKSKLRRTTFGVRWGTNHNYIYTQTPRNLRSEDMRQSNFGWFAPKSSFSTIYMCIYFSILKDKSEQNSRLCLVRVVVLKSDQFEISVKSLVVKFTAKQSRHHISQYMYIYSKEVQQAAIAFALSWVLTICAKLSWRIKNLSPKERDESNEIIRWWSGVGPIDWKRWWFELIFSALRLDCDFNWLSYIAWSGIWLTCLGGDSSWNGNRCDVYFNITHNIVFNP